MSLVLDSSSQGAASHWWPLVLEGPPSNNTSNTVLRLAPSRTGEGFIFKGRDFMHWRGRLSRGEHSTVALLHFVRESSHIPEVSCTTVIRTRIPMKFDKSASSPLPGQRWQNTSADAVECEVIRGKTNLDDHQGMTSAPTIPRATYFLYSPCAELPQNDTDESDVNSDASPDPICAQQFSNQVHLGCTKLSSNKEKD